MTRFNITRFAISATFVFITFSSVQCKKDTPSDNVEALTMLLASPAAQQTNASNSSNPLFVDNGDGTVSATSQGLVWAKCPQSPTGNRFNAASNLCNVDTFGRFNYCSQANGNCSNGDSAGTLRLPFLNGAESQIFRSCANLTLAGRTWRVPTRVELARFFYNLYLLDTKGVFNGAYESGGGVDNRFWSSSGGGSSGGVELAWHGM